MATNPVGAALGGSDSLRDTPNILSRAAIPSLLCALVLSAAWIIRLHPQAPVWDQLALLESSLSGPIVPAPATGLTSQLIVALAKLALPTDPTALDTEVRTLAMALYLCAAALLGSHLLARRSAVALLLVVLVTSQYPFLWVSSELFTGAFLMFAIAAWSRGAPAAATGALLALFGLCKPDAILVAISLLAWWAIRAASRREAAALAAGFSAMLLALLLPGTLSAGWEYFNTYGGSGGRSFASFGQHYAVIVARFQIGPEVPNPWRESAVYLQSHFPGATGMSDVVFGHPSRYLEFVALSCVRGLFRAGYVANYAALAIPILLYAGHRARITPSDRALTLLLSFIGVLPLVLLSYPHVRYLTRFYPIFALLLLMALERLHATRDPAARPAVALGAACLGFSLLENAMRFASSLARLPETQLYWFPD